MTFSYNQDLPTPLDRVRHMLGDVSAPGYRSNETITALLSEHSEPLTAMYLADSLAAEFAMKPSSLSGPDGSITWGDRVLALQALSKRLKLEIDEEIVDKAKDKLRSFAPSRETVEIDASEYRRPLAPQFFDRNGNYWWSEE
jgi:hypothetical protein